MAAFEAGGRTGALERQGTAISLFIRYLMVCSRVCSNEGFCSKMTAAGLCGGTGK
ncbi:hypothetical protein [Desulfotomaculum copahuensis]|uniref:hypothetical protein n=1 Tax=Desulfotomaculum copahuensis TaxID=1838280 RepID=UPI00137274EB|nr:hypothetical protein [Desulfotomaculum copahuensis]